MLNRVRIVLVNTSHPGNIGSAARAMKTMGLESLVLVDPIYFPDPKAVELAAGADDILEKAQVTQSLEEALKGCSLVIGTSARSREIATKMVNPRQCAELVQTEVMQGEVAIVFGREKSGLSNEELAHCHYHVMIPSNPEYSSLNLAQAVQVIAYELRMALLENDIVQPQLDAYAEFSDVERLFEHFERVLIATDFLRPAYPKKLMPRLRRLFNRTRLEVMEVNLLRGMLTSVEVMLKKIPKI